MNKILRNVSLAFFLTSCCVMAMDDNTLEPQGGSSGAQVRMVPVTAQTSSSVFIDPLGYLRERAITVIQRFWSGDSNAASVQEAASAGFTAGTVASRLVDLEEQLKILQEENSALKSQKDEMLSRAAAAEGALGVYREQAHLFQSSLGETQIVLAKKEVAIEELTKGLNVLANSQNPKYDIRLREQERLEKMGVELQNDLDSKTTELQQLKEKKISYEYQDQQQNAPDNLKDLIKQTAERITTLEIEIAEKKVRITEIKRDNDELIRQIESTWFFSTVDGELSRCSSRSEDEMITTLVTLAHNWRELRKMPQENGQPDSFKDMIASRLLAKKDNESGKMSHRLYTAEDIAERGRALALAFFKRKGIAKIATDLLYSEFFEELLLNYNEAINSSAQKQLESDIVEYRQHRRVDVSASRMCAQVKALSAYMDNLKKVTGGK